jgi:hypothetical protein
MVEYSLDFERVEAIAAITGSSMSSAFMRDFPVRCANESFTDCSKPNGRRLW